MTNQDKGLSVHRLEEAQANLSDGAEISQVAEVAGHIAVDVARRATEDFYRALHDVSDVALELPDKEVYGKARDRAREFLRETSESPATREHAMQAVASLIGELKRETPEDFHLALKAKEVATILLGPKRLGGVYAVWQVSTLGVGVLSWIEQQGLNLRVLGLTQDLDKKQAERDVERFRLPELKFLQMGCHGNISKACFRAVVEGECEGHPAEAVAKVGSAALEKIDREVVFDPAYRKYILPMIAMEAAIEEQFGHATSFWSRLSSEEIQSILLEIENTEPSEELRALVLESARQSGIQGLVPRLQRRSEPFVVAAGGSRSA